MLIWIFKTFFGKAIGLDRIPPHRRDYAAKLVLEAIQNSEVSYNPKSGEISYRIKKEF